MFKNYLSLMLVCLLVSAINVEPALAPTKGKEQPPPIEKIKANVAKRGVGEKARVKIKLQDGTKVHGYISQAGEDNFVVMDSKTGQTTTLAYRDVSEVKGKAGLSTAAKIGIGVAIGVGVAAAAVGLAINSGCVPLGCN